MISGLLKIMSLFCKRALKRDYILQKGPINNLYLRTLLIVATPQDILCVFAALKSIYASYLICPPTLLSSTLVSSHTRTLSLSSLSLSLSLSLACVYTYVSMYIYLETYMLNLCLFFLALSSLLSIIATCTQHLACHVHNTHQLVHIHIPVGICIHTYVHT